MNQFSDASLYRDFPDFSLQTRMSDLICVDYPLLLIITRFGIPLGFGEDSLGEVCKKHNIDADTLLILLNFSKDHGMKTYSLEELSKLNMSSLLEYLANSHAYFLDFRLPLLRQRLLSAISTCPKEVAYVIQNFFDEYVEEVRKHMSYEEKTVFPYALSLAEGVKKRGYNIRTFSKKHDQIELKITELKNILIKYYPVASGYELTNVLHDIFTTEEDLATHNNIEDKIFIPYIKALEDGLI